jgi:hypothetical protein
VVLPLLLAGGLALSFYLRRKLRRARQDARQPSSSYPPPRPADHIIDVEYTVVDHGGEKRP